MGWGYGGRGGGVEVGAAFPFLIPERCAFHLTAAQTRGHMQRPPAGRRCLTKSLSHVVTGELQRAACREYDGGVKRGIGYGGWFVESSFTV